MRNAERGLSVGDETELVGEDAPASRFERAGEVGAVDEFEVDSTESMDSSSMLTTSQPSTIDSDVEDESEEDTKLALLRLTVDVNAVPVGDCARKCSFSLPLSPPNSLFTPKLSLRLSDLL